MSTHYPRATDRGNSFVNFVLLRSSAFIRQARKIVNKQPSIAENIQNTLTLLIQDPFDLD